jgi:hypothetical protein
MVAKVFRCVNVRRVEGAMDREIQLRTGGRNELLGTVTELKERTVLILARQKRPAIMSFKWFFE